MAHAISLKFNEHGTLPPDMARAVRDYMQSPETPTGRQDSELLSLFMVTSAQPSHTFPVASRVNLHDFSLSARQRALFRKNMDYHLTLSKGYEAFKQGQSEYLALRNAYHEHADPLIEKHDFWKKEGFYPTRTHFYQVDARDKDGRLMGCNALAVRYREAVGNTHYYTQAGRATSLGRFMVLAGLQILKDADVCDVVHLGSYTPQQKTLAWKNEIGPIELAHIDRLGCIAWQKYTRGALKDGRWPPAPNQT